MFVKEAKLRAKKNYLLRVRSESGGLSPAFDSKGLSQSRALLEFPGAEGGQWDPLGPFGNVSPSLKR